MSALKHHGSQDRFLYSRIIAGVSVKDHILNLKEFTKIFSHITLISIRSSFQVPRKLFDL